MKTLACLTVLLASATVCLSALVKAPNKNFELLILHNNDMHARFEQTSQLSGACTMADREAGKCYGGFPRVAHVVKEARRAAQSGEGPPVLYLNAGDTYTGTAWFTIYKWKIAAEFINALQPDAVSLGNHEFDNGVSGLTPFIENITSPVLCANLVLTKEPDLAREQNLKNSIVLDVSGHKIGIVGYLTPETKILARPNNVDYIDEIVALKKEVKKLQEERTNIIIALGHSGYKKDLEIAKEVDGLDLVIGGHTNTFLWNGTVPDIEKSQSSYPTYVTQASGRRVPVVQAYAYTKYLGKLLLTFDSNDEVIGADGLPILLNSLGNHEFDEAVAGVIPFIKNLSSPVLAANLILDKVPELKEETNLHKSIIIIKKEIKIGIIGYLTGETKTLAPKNNVEYEDEVPALKREVKRLKHQGINILIALGHSGFIKDLEIAKYVEDLDLVIGGHSNTFLSNKNNTGEIPEIPQGPYPTEVKQDSGRIVRVVQAYAYTKYLGKLHLIFNSDGEIVKCDGEPILLNQKIPRDQELLNIVNKYRSNVDKINNVIVGSSMVTLHGEYCRLKECNIGDFITDSILDYTKTIGSSNVNVVIIQGGRIRASIDRPQKPFEITRGDWITVLPFSDSLTMLTMNGMVLRSALEHAVRNWRKIDSPGQFLQFSGLRVVYDLARPPGARVATAKAACSTCNNEISEIEDYLEYKVMTCTFLAEGGDGFTMFEGLPSEIFSYNEVDAVLYHMNRTGIITQKEDGRLIVQNEDTVEETAEAIMNRFLGSNGTIYVPNKILYSLLIILATVIQCIH